MLHSSFATKTNTDAFIYGEKGTIYLHPRFHHPEKMTLYLNGMPPQEISMPHNGYGYQFEIMEVNRCLKKNLLESPLMDWQKSLLLADALEKIRQKIGLVYPNHDL
jgi:hypothetical protein